MIFGWAVIGGGEEDNASQKKSQQESQQPDRKLPLDHVTPIWTLRKNKEDIIRWWFNHIFDLILAATECQAVFIWRGKALAFSRLEGEHTRQWSSDQLETVEWASPVFIFFIGVDYRDAEQQQDLQRCLMSSMNNSKMINMEWKVSKQLWPPTPGINFFQSTNTHP